MSEWDLFDLGSSDPFSDRRRVSAPDDVADPRCRPSVSVVAALTFWYGCVLFSRALRSLGRGTLGALASLRVSAPARRAIVTGSSSAPAERVTPQAN